MVICYRLKTWPETEWNSVFVPKRRFPTWKENVGTYCAEWFARSV